MWGCQLYGQEIPLEVIFSLDGGFYDSTLVIKLVEPGGGDVFYTEDGSQPTRQSKTYRKPIPVNASKVLRAIAYRGGDRSPVATHTYFLGVEKSNLPILSISIEPWRLFDSEHGLFLQGAKVDTGTMHLSGANFWDREEYVAGLEFYETDQELVFNSKIGLRLFGGISRLFPQKSLAIFAREAYGEKHIDHRIFGKEGPKKFRNLVLRNAGSDFGKGHIRDAFITQVAKDWEVDVQAYRPAHVYINAQYWGIYNLREKINEHFIANHHEVDKDSLDLLEHYMTVKKGKRKAYQNFLNFIENRDLQDPAVYQAVQEMMDIESFIDLQIAQIFFDNRDAGGNVRYWKAQTEEAKWRWILFDMDWGMGLHSADAFQFNSLLFHTEADGPSWPNPPWSTFLLRKLLTSDAFKQAFITRFSDRLNTDLQPQALLAALDQREAHLAPEMPLHLDRWNLSAQRREHHFNRMRQFVAERPSFVRTHLQEFFELDTQVPFDLAVAKGGRVVVNRNFELEQKRVQGFYYRDYPIYLRAEAHLGYRFLHWIDAEGNEIKAETLLLDLSRKGIQLQAVFEPYNHPLLGALVINEVAPNGKSAKDWVELFNESNQRIYLEGFVLRDKKGNLFEFPERSYIDPKDYLIVCQNKEKFLRAFPTAYNVIGDLGFGINKHQESLQLYDERKASIDSVAYQLSPLDSSYSWSLLLPNLDNGDPENWQQLLGQGTPGAPNPYYMESRILSEQSNWIKISLGVALLVLLVFFSFLSWKQE